MARNLLEIEKAVVNPGLGGNCLLDFLTQCCSSLLSGSR